ncbi:hypothetical protein VTO42DRAFT_2188 [Malbranchea cinnamomea]
MADQRTTKPELEHNEGDLKHNDVVLKSHHDHLGLWATIKRFKKAVLICNLLSIAAAADGYQYTMNGNVIANQGFINHLGFLNDEGVYTLNAQYTALWGAMQSLGQMIGMVLLNPVSDRIGRKMTLYLLWIILGGSIALETAVRDWRDWTGAKLLAGIGVGSLQATLPIYITEWSPANIRGAMVLSYGFWNAIGKFLAPLVLTLVEKRDRLNYLDPILTQWGFLGIMLPIFLWLPETPHYYAERDMDERGKQALRRVNGNVKGYDVELEYSIIKNTILEERRLRQEALGPEGSKTWIRVMKSYIECFKGPNARRTLGAALPACAQQLTGLAFLNVYASLFFKQSGFTDAFLITTILTVISMVTAIFLMLFTDKFGRRLVVLVSTIVCTIAMLIVGILGEVTVTAPLKKFLIFVACVWSFFSVALGALGWAFVGEIASQKLRARTAGLAAGASVVFGLTFNTSVPVILDVNGADWGYKTAWLFFATGTVTSVIVYFFVPEPSRRNAAEMDEMFEKGVPAWKMKNYVTEIQTQRQQNVEFKQTV